MPYVPQLNQDALMQGYAQADPRIVGALRGFVVGNDVAASLQQEDEQNNQETNDNN